jgi:hypothetical protein
VYGLLSARRTIHIESPLLETSPRRTTAAGAGSGEVSLEKIRRPTE